MSPNSHSSHLSVSLSHHQTTTACAKPCPMPCCISFYFIIKPQPCTTRMPFLPVVYHSISSSNHNKNCPVNCRYFVVYHSISSSNHNVQLPSVSLNGLYIILFHHQTTTMTVKAFSQAVLYIILFHHQTTTASQSQKTEASCISFYFIIKPQPPIFR